MTFTVENLVHFSFFSGLKGPFHHVKPDVAPLDAEELHS